MDNLEPRVSVVETHIDHIRGDLGELKADVRALRHDLSTLRVDLVGLRSLVNTLPTKGFIVSTVTTTGAALGAVVVLLRFLAP